MNREQFIKKLVSQFEEQISHLSAEKLEKLESGKLEISITPAVGNEAGGASAMSAGPAKTRANAPLGAATASAAPGTRRTTDIRRP